MKGLAKGAMPLKKTTKLCAHASTLSSQAPLLPSLLGHAQSNPHQSPKLEENIECE